MLQEGFNIPQVVVKAPGEEEWVVHLTDAISRELKLEGVQGLNLAGQRRSLYPERSCPW